MAAHAEEWAGIPMPIEGEQLVIEPSYKFASIFNKPEETKDEGGEYAIRNVFWSRRCRREVVVFEDGKGRVRKIVELHSRLDMELRTLGCSAAWGVEQEAAAIQLLGTLVRHHTFKNYLMTGMLLERSERSGVMYVFRRLRPTIALRFQGERVKILAALCMHPIGYYRGSWAGSMCPTDDVIAHLQLMRGDEPMFWRRCAQHHPEHNEAGL